MAVGVGLLAMGFLSFFSPVFTERLDLQDVSEPVNLGLPDGILLEEVVLHQFHPPSGQSVRVSLRPEALPLFHVGRAVLDHKAQVRVLGQQLQGESTWLWLA